MDTLSKCCRVFQRLVHVRSGPPLLLLVLALATFTPLHPTRQKANAAPLLGIISPSGGAVLVRLDPSSLELLEGRVIVGEYHWTWSFSPDGSRLALGISAPGAVGRLGIQIIDVEQMETVGKVETGIAAEIVTWLTPERIVAALQGGGIVLVDCATGDIVRRGTEPFEPPVTLPPKPVAFIGSGVVYLLAHSSKPIPALALVDARGNLRSVTLDRLTSAVIHSATAGIRIATMHASLAVDVVRDRAFVVAPDALVAEVNLKTMHVRYLKLQGLERRGRASTRHALWLGDRFIAIFGPAGVAVIDTSDWRVRTIDARASKAAVAAGKLLVYGTHSPGLRAYSVDGRQHFALFGEEGIRDVLIAKNYAYVIGTRRLRIVDITSGTVLREVPTPLGLVELIRPSR